MPHADAAGTKNNIREKTVKVSSGQTVKVHQAIAYALAANGIDTLFGLMGDGNMFMCEAFIRECGGRFVAAAHEGGAAMMALGYAHVSDTVGVASVTHGPGLVNTMTALVQGVKGSTPMVLICGDTPVEARGRLQDVPQRDFVLVTGAGFEQIRTPRTAVQDVATALRRALIERRPIVLNAPVEFDWVDVDYHPIMFSIPDRRAIVPEGDDLDNAIGIIAAARKPLIVAGRGATTGPARASIAALARRIEAPLATTLKAKDLFAGDPYDLGICGIESNTLAVEQIVESDCLLFFGASITAATTSKGTFLKGKRVIQVNQEPGDIGKFGAPTVGLVGDPGRTADLILHWLAAAEIPGSGNYTDDLRDRIAAFAPELPASADNGNGTVDYLHAVTTLDRILPPDRILVSDGGRFVRGSWIHLKTQGPGSFVPALDFGSIGLGLAHAIGAACASQGRPVVLVVGDGGLMNAGLAEFNTAVRYKLDLIVVVGNDRAYGAEHVKFARRQRPPEESTFDWPDFAPVATALGGAGITVQSAADWPAVATAIAARDRPLLIDVRLDPALLTAAD
jgi:acetolactate synthase I/II/III large subunit